MVKKPTVAEPQPAKLTAPEMDRGIRRLKRRLEAVKAFDPNTLDRQDPRSTVRPLAQDVQTALVETFGNDSIEYRRFSGAAKFDWALVIGDIPHHEKVSDIAECRVRSIQLIESAINLLEERLSDLGEATAAPGAPNPPMAVSRRIFVVHGHDAEPKEAIARFLSDLGYEPVILHEQPNRGRTIIQKFQDEAADVGFAIVLMTADDAMSDGRNRARQNVVLELGFFLGRLGPDRVAAVVKGDIERPSDFDGVLYIAYDAAWKQTIAREMQAAGYEIDWNRLMR